MSARTMSHLSGVIGTTDEEGGLPNLDSGDYQPHSRASNKPVYAIHFITAGWEVRSFQYADLDSDSRYTPDAIHLRFTGTKLLDVTIHGRNLWKLYDGIHRQVISWVMEAGRDFAKDGERVVTRVEIARVAGQVPE